MSHTRSVEVLAPCKVILSGEHAVVYGKHAVAVAVDIHTRVHLMMEEKPSDSTDSAAAIVVDIVNMNSHHHRIEPHSIHRLAQVISEACNLRDGVYEFCDEVIPELQKCCSTSANSPQGSAEAVIAFTFAAMTAARPDGRLRECGNLVVSVSGGVPIGAGLGSSASFCVGLCLGLLELAGVSHAKELVNRWAYQAETIIHGTPSGVDNSVVTFGGAMLYRRGHEMEPLESLPNIPVLIVNTKVSRSTKALVDGVRQFSIDFPSVAESMFATIDTIALEVAEALESSDRSSSTRLSRLVELNQHMLRGLGVGHASIDSIISTCASYGVSAKLTGAGGGGCVIALPRHDMDQETLQNLTSDMEASGFQVLSAHITSTGVAVVPS